MHYLVRESLSTFTSYSFQIWVNSDSETWKDNFCDLQLINQWYKFQYDVPTTQIVCGVGIARNIASYLTFSDIGIYSGT